MVPERLEFMAKQWSHYTEPISLTRFDSAIIPAPSMEALTDIIAPLTEIALKYAIVSLFGNPTVLTIAAR